MTALPETAPRHMTKVTMRDPSLPHQIVINTMPGSTHQIYVSCNCRAVRGAHGGVTGYQPLEARTRWDAHDALAVYRAHLPAAERGAA